MNVLVSGAVRLEASMKEDAPTSLRTLLMRKTLRESGYVVFRTVTPQGSKWFWRKEASGTLEEAGVDFSEELFSSEAEALEAARLQVKRYSMGYGQWIRLTLAQQNAYLQRHALEFRGYTLTGADSEPTHIEFSDKLNALF